MCSVLLFLGGVGMQEILVIGIFVLIFFGARKVPEFMKGLGKGVREFKTGMNEFQRDLDRDDSPSKSTTTPSQPTETKKPETESTRTQVER